MNTFGSLGSTFPALAGGLATTIAADYMGFGSPLIGILGASAGAAALTGLQRFYEENKDLLPGADTVRSAVDRMHARIGIKFFTVIVKRQEDVIFNKLQVYLLHKYSDNLVTSSIGKTDNVNLELNLDSSAFSKPIIDHYDGNRVFILLKHGEIHVRSQSMEIPALKEYIKKILLMRIGTRTITVHQPTVTPRAAMKSTKNLEEKMGSDVAWTSFTIQTNKNFKNTILTQTVQKGLIDDLARFTSNEDYYNDKGIPYKRGYLLYGPPGTGKTSILKAIASHYGMDIYLINLGDVETEKDLVTIFQGTRTSTGYHILCFEDIDRCDFLKKDYYRENNKKASLFRTFLNELDGVIETPKRITIMTVNDKSVIDQYPALSRPGRIDRKIELGHCDGDQVSRLYNHFTDSKETLSLDSIDIEITPAQVVKHILNNPLMGVEDIKKELKVISDIEVKERSLGDAANAGGGRSRRKRSRKRYDQLTTVQKKRYRISRYKSDIRFLNSIMRTTPKKLESKQKALERATLQLAKSINAEKKRKELAKKREKAAKLKEKTVAKKRNLEDIKRHVKKGSGNKRRKLNTKYVGV